MKKMILLLLLPLTVLMAIDFTMTEQGLFTNTTTQTPASTTTQTPASTTASEASSSYLEPVNIPAYDSSNPSHLLITVSNNKWTSTNLNNSSYKHFYVEPGNYSASLITLTADGTTDDRRSISLYNGNDTHPASLTVAEQADIKIKFDNADYWDIDRMSGLSYQATTDIRWFTNGASYNTINRHHLKDYYNGIRIYNACNYNTIQNSYLDEMTLAGRKSDNVAISLSSYDYGAGGRIYGTKIINNEIHNANDGVQLIRSGTSNGYLLDLSYTGTVIDSNIIWIDSSIYTDGSGNPDPSGVYSYSENAIDFKVGSDDSANPVIVTNNKMWGHRRTDGTGSALSDAGANSVAHFGTENVIYHNNVVFDSNRGFAATGVSNMSFTIKDSEIKNNIFYDIGFQAGTTEGLMLDVADFRNLDMQNNTFVKTNNSGWYRENSGATGAIVSKNVIISCSGSSGTPDTSDANYYYNTTNNWNDPNDVNEASADTAVMTDLVFSYGNFTTNPQQKILTGVITTETSPHYGKAGSSIGN